MRTSSRGAPGNGSCSRLLRQVSRLGGPVIVSQNEDNDESIQGTTWGDVQGVQGLTRICRNQGRPGGKLDDDS
jgi:hypothetical protein